MVNLEDNKRSVTCEASLCCTLILSSGYEDQGKVIGAVGAELSRFLNINISGENNNAYNLP